MARIARFQLTAALLLATPLHAAETLDNGIILPDEWPPVRQELTREPMPVPYLKERPEVIPIDVGRQFFVDDFLIEETSLHRTFHRAEFHPATPVLRPDQRWEKTDTQPESPTAMPFSDGIWFDPKDGLFKMWYMGGYVGPTCYATSRDGLHWDKPHLDIVPGTNIVHKSTRDSSTVWLDLAEKDPARRYKLFFYGHPGHAGKLTICFSSDGIHWTQAGDTGPCGDRSSVFWNPFRGVWVYSIRSDDPVGGSSPARTRRYREGRDLLAAAGWKAGEPVLWVGADGRDPQRPDLGTVPQLYNLDAVAYESVLLGLFSVWYGQPRDRPKPNQICLGFSRDGFHWDRPDRTPFIGVSEQKGDWNWGNVQSAGGCCLVVGDRLYFYVSGRAGVKGSAMSGVCSTGLATLRRDGFASMDAGDAPGTLTTRPVVFKGRYLFLNADMAGGELRVEILDRDGKPIPLFPMRRCMPVTTDTTMQEIRWPEAPDLSSIAGQPVRFRFHLARGKLYSFWVSDDRSGASHGYVAAGGPGFTSHQDTVGQAAYDAAAPLASAAKTGSALAPASKPAWECMTAHTPFEPRDCAERFILNGQMWLSNGYWSDKVHFRDLWRSSDGRSWTRVLEQAPYDVYARTVVYRDKIWAIHGSVWNSSDGIHWEKVLDKTPSGPGGHLGALAFKDRIWVLGADRNVWSTTDGVDWTQATDNAAFGDRACAAVAVYDDRLWLMGGRTERPNDPPEGTYKQFTTHNDVWSSQDGATWTRVCEHAPWAPRMWPVAIEYAGRLWLIGGFDNVNRRNFGEVWTTRDGRTWERFESVPHFAGRHASTPYVFKGSLWVVAGNTWPIVNDVWRLTLPPDR